jgi:hypothetical protein
LGLDAMGYWYEPEEVSALAKKYGLHAQFVPSDLYPYRFHAVIRKIKANKEEQNRKTKGQASLRSFEKLGRSAYCKLPS